MNEALHLEHSSPSIQAGACEGSDGVAAAAADGVAEADDAGADALAAVDGNATGAGELGEPFGSEGSAALPVLCSVGDGAVAVRSCTFFTAKSCADCAAFFAESRKLLNRLGSASEELAAVAALGDAADASAGPAEGAGAAAAGVSSLEVKFWTDFAASFAASLAASFAESTKLLNRLNISQL